MEGKEQKRGKRSGREEGGVGVDRLGRKGILRGRGREGEQGQEQRRTKD